MLRITNWGCGARRFRAWFRVQGYGFLRRVYERLNPEPAPNEVVMNSTLGSNVHEFLSSKPSQDPLNNLNPMPTQVSVWEAGSTTAPFQLRRARLP